MNTSRLARRLHFSYAVLMLAATFALADSDSSVPRGLSGITGATVSGYDSVKSDGKGDMSGNAPPRTEALVSQDSVRRDSAEAARSSPARREAAATAPDSSASATAPRPMVTFTTLGGDLPRIVTASGAPYLVIADIYVPSGKTVKIEAGAVLLFKNFTGLHAEGKLLAEGTAERPIVFSSEFDRSFNPSAALHANPFDWNGIYIHEGGLGTSMAYCKVLYSVYGINSLTKYIRLNAMTFSGNGRSDLTIEEKRQTVTLGPFAYAVTLDDARKDGVPVNVLMDPRAKKRGVFKFGGLTLLTGGCVMAVWSGVQMQRDQNRLNGLSRTEVVDEHSSIVLNTNPDWENAKNARNIDRGLTVSGIICALLGGAGFGFSFTF